jgi:hypothetical protein
MIFIGVPEPCFIQPCGMSAAERYWIGPGTCLERTHGTLRFRLRKRRWTEGIKYTIQKVTLLNRCVFLELVEPGRGQVDMYSSQQKISSPEVAELRREAGSYLKELREKRGLSQRQMAELVGGNYYTFISQLESGRGRIPPDRYLIWAEVLDVKPDVFVKNLLRYYDPVTFSILFGDK